MIVIYEERGEYSDYTMIIRGVAASASDAVNACEHFARKVAERMKQNASEQENQECPVIVRKLKPTDDVNAKHPESWVVFRTNEYDRETDHADNYNAISVSWQEVESWPPRGS
jgi:hypothetical protein